MSLYKKHPFTVNTGDSQSFTVIHGSRKKKKNMQNNRQNNPLVGRGDALGDKEWLAGGTDLHLLGKKCSDMDKNKGKIPPPRRSTMDKNKGKIPPPRHSTMDKIPPPRRSTSSSSSGGGFDDWFHGSPPLDPCPMKFPPVDGNGNPVLPIRRAPGGANTQSGEDAGANVSTTNTQPGGGAGK